jgi:hypothetical protein
VDDFEHSLEADLLAAKFRDHLTRDQASGLLRQDRRAALGLALPAWAEITRGQAWRPTPSPSRPGRRWRVGGRRG